MSFVYTRANLKSRLNAGIFGKIGMLTSSEETMNSAVRQVLSEIDLRSSQRSASLQPKLFEDVFSYSAPTDLKGYKIIDVPPQLKVNNREWFLVPGEEFRRFQERKNDMIAVDDYNGIRRILLSTQLSDTQKLIAVLDSSASGGGTWAAFGDAENITYDSANVLRGAKSLNFDISSAGGTTAGIKNTGLNSIDIDEDFLDGEGSLFAFVYLSNADDITNFILRIGSSESDYSQKTITTTHEGAAFATGWNLLRFDLTNLTTVGSPNNDEIDYVAIYMTKSASKVSQTDFRFNYIILRKGKIHELRYYSKYLWQSSAGAYKENSTDDGDLIVVDTDEMELIIEKAKTLGAEETKDFDVNKIYKENYKEMKENYILNNPSQAMIMTSEYHNY